MLITCNEVILKVCWIYKWGCYFQCGCDYCNICQLLCYVLVFRHLHKIHIYYYGYINIWKSSQYLDLRLWDVSIFGHFYEIYTDYYGMYHYLYIFMGLGDIRLAGTWFLEFFIHGLKLVPTVLWLVATIRPLEYVYKVLVCVMDPWEKQVYLLTGYIWFLEWTEIYDCYHHYCWNDFLSGLGYITNYRYISLNVYLFMYLRYSYYIIVESWFVDLVVVGSQSLDLSCIYWLVLD